MIFLAIASVLSLAGRFAPPARSEARTAGAQRLASIPVVVSGY